jgi:hypothetical protein
MRMRVRNDDDRGGAEAPRWVGAELVEVAERTGRGDASWDQHVAFEVALAVRDEPGPKPLAALTALLVRLTSGSASPTYGTLVNTLTAVQHALALDDEESGLWVPPANAIGAIVLKAMAENDLMRDQADDLLRALAAWHPVAPWLGDRAAEVVANVRDPELREALARGGGGA